MESFWDVMAREAVGDAKESGIYHMDSAADVN